MWSPPAQGFPLPTHLLLPHAHPRQGHRRSVPGLQSRALEGGVVVICWWCRTAASYSPGADPGQHPALRT